MKVEDISFHSFALTSLLQIKQNERNLYVQSSHFMQMKSFLIVYFHATMYNRIHTSHMEC